ncbi:diguanylate cyclase domain-containing protein [Acinetobacter sp. ULE_I010]|uniref:sensor domain-containing diguanylate cyclase n=1 Tax=Acinetobacter sp. ULE_I010 TaxID=3373065 RepID=UPI003AF74540
MELESVKLKQSLEDISVFDYLQNLDKLHLVSFISQIPLPIALFDKNARFLGVNQKFSDIYECDALYLFDKSLRTFSTVVYAQFNEALLHFNQQHQYFEQEFYVKGKFYLGYYKVGRDQNNDIETILLVCSDVTRLKRRENVLLQNNQKLHDHLYLDFVTGLQNKIALDHYLSGLAQKKRKTDISFLKLDLDDFKRFNQLNSYTKGDEVLAQLGSVLNEAVSQTEVKIFRLNSASFVVVVEGLTEWAVVTLAERLKFAIFNEKIQLGAIFEYLTASIGIYHLNQADCLVNPENLNDDRPKDLSVDVLQKLDRAVRDAKTLGKNALAIYKVDP